MDLSWIKQLQPIFDILVLIVLPLLAKWLPAFRKKALLASLWFGKLSTSFKNPEDTNADFDALWKEAEVVLADPPGQPLTWNDMLKIDWGPGGLYKQLKGPAFVLLYVLLGLFSGIAAVLHLLTTFLV